MPNSFPIECRDQKSIIAVGVVFSALATVAVGMRLVSRRIIRRALDWSDYLIIAACVSIWELWELGEMEKILILSADNGNILLGHGISR
jgi:hypothetical protein